MKRLGKVKKNLIICSQIIVYFMKDFLELLKEYRFPWLICPLLLGFFFSGFARIRTSNLISESCEKAYSYYINLKRELINLVRTDEGLELVRTYIEFTYEEFEEVRKEADRAKFACELGFKEADKHTWKYDLFGWQERLKKVVLFGLMESSLLLFSRFLNT